MGHEWEGSIKTNSNSCVLCKEDIQRKEDFLSDFGSRKTLHCASVYHNVYREKKYSIYPSIILCFMSF